MHMVKQFTNKAGKEIVIRYPTLDDAAAMTDYINTLSKERTFISFQGEEMSLEEEKKFLADKLKNIQEKKAVLLLAFHNDTLIANSAVQMKDKIEKHIGIFGISVAKAYRGEGVGRILMDTVIEQTKEHIPQIELLTLSVFHNNGKACALYESFGFKKYGMLPGGVKLPDGYADHVYMYKRVR